MKICFITPPIGTCGGIQRVVTVLASQMAKNHTVSIITVNDNMERPFYELNEEIQVIHYNYCHNKKKYLERALRMMVKRFSLVLSPFLAQYVFYPQYIVRDFGLILESKKYDCIIGVSNQYAVLLGLLSERLKNIRLIGWQHNSYEIYFQTPGTGFFLQRRLSEYALPKLGSLITLTKHDAQKYKDNMQIDADYIYDPLSFSSEKKADMTEKVLLFLGRIEVRQKGMDLLIQIAEEIFCKRGMHDWKLKIVGDGTGFADTKSWINEKNLQPYVELLGEKKNVREYYIGASIFLSTSRWEGFGMVITEAMECGLPVVAFENDGPSEIISNGENGYLIEKENCMQFADTLEKLMKDLELRKRLSANAVERAARFSVERITKDWEEKIIAKHK